MKELEIEYRARKFSEEAIVNADKRKGFIAGAKWAIDMLIRITDVHPMEESAGATEICNKFRLREVNKFLNEVSKYRESEGS